MFDLVASLQFSVHGGADSGGGVAGAVDGFLGFVESLLTLSPADMFAGIMPGLAAMDNLHPLFVHFPIALLSLFFLLDLVGSVSDKPAWRGAAGWFLYGGTLFAAITVAAGLIAAGSVPHGGDVHEIMEHHQHLGISVLLLASTLAGWRLLAKQPIVGPANTLYQLLACILCGLVFFTADLGGLMVYKYGVAVEPVARINREAVELHQHGGESDEHDHAGADSDADPLEQHHNHAH